MRYMLLGYSFKPRPHGRVLGQAGSVNSCRSVRLSINGCAHSENQFDERKQDWLVQKFDLQRLQRLDPIQALLLDQQEDKGDSAHRLQHEALIKLEMESIEPLWAKSLKHSKQRLREVQVCK